MYVHQQSNSTKPKQENDTDKNTAYFTVQQIIL